MRDIRVAVAVAALSLAAAPIAFAGPQAHPPAAVAHGQAGAHGKAGEAHGAADGTKARAQSGADIATRISRNPKLEARLSPMIPSGMTMEQAASGFRNHGQFIAALEASKNQNSPFTDLKAAMTGNPPLSLGEAIRKLKPAPTATTGSKTSTKKPESAKVDKDTD